MSDAVDGELSLWSRLLYRVHLALCPACKRRDGSFRETVCTLQAMRDCAPWVEPNEPPTDER